MTNHFKIKLGSSASSVQAELMQFLKNQGDDVIQLSDGLCVKTSKDISAFQSGLKQKGFTTLIFETIEAEAILADDSAPKDLQAFIAQPNQ